MTDSRIGSLENILQARSSRPRLRDVDPTVSSSDTRATPELRALPSPTTTPGDTEPLPAASGSGEGGSAVRSRTKTASTPRVPVTKPAASEEASAPGRVRVVLRVDAALRERMAQAQTSRAGSLADVVFDAVESAVTAAAFPRLLASTGPEPTSQGLFSRASGRQAQPKVSLELSMTAHDRAVLDELVTTHDAPSRTQLIIAALSDFLA